MNKVSPLVIVLVFLVLGSCKKKDPEPDYCSTSWYTEVQTELTAVANAAMVFGTAPTTENCTSYKAAISKYIDALEPFGKCTTLSAVQKAEWNDAIDEARADLANACD